MSELNGKEVLALKAAHLSEVARSITGGHGIHGHVPPCSIDDLPYLLEVLLIANDLYGSQVVQNALEAEMDLPKEGKYAVKFTHKF